MTDTSENQTTINDDAVAENADASEANEGNTNAAESQTTPGETDAVAPETTQGEVTIDGVLAELNAARLEAQTNLEGWQRSRAEFVNYKRRTSQELTESRERGAQEAIEKFIPIIDDFERAVQNIPEDLEGHDWVTGTALILKNMQKVLDQYNVQMIDPVGQEFDPNLHEAVGMDDSDEYESGIVTATLQKGYVSDGRVLRPALVRVAN